jgi:phosphoadenosine phosphosulfate reductase
MLQMQDYIALVGLVRWRFNMLGLAFSGGKDSFACWYLYRDQNPVVLWVNTGKIYPETLAIVNEVRAEAKHFIEIKSDQQAQIDANGLPSDIVPIDWTTDGMNYTGQKSVKVQSYLGCHFQNIAIPLMKAAHDNGVTKLIRGQRLDEPKKSTAVNGSIVDGITYIQPIENWTKKQVLDFIVSQRGELPEHYHIEHSSLDCYDCTAFMADSVDRIEWTKTKHPDLYDKYLIKMNALKSTLKPTIKLLGLT